jgi:hypothetical protein
MLIENDLKTLEPRKIEPPTTEVISVIFLAGRLYNSL